MIRIIIVDDHPMVRRGLRDAVAGESDITVVAETGVPDEVLPAIRLHPCDVVLLDMNLPGRGGMEILKDVHREWPDLRVLVVSSIPNPSTPCAPSRPERRATWSRRAHRQNWFARFVP